MDGTVADRELTCAARMGFAVATPADDEVIRRLLRDNPMPGLVRLTFEREPDYFLGAGLAGAADQTVVSFSNGRLVCMGRCSQRDCWINGRTARVGYLAELRLDATARGRFAHVRGGYRFFHELQRPAPAELYFTSVAADNHRARRFLERGARGMPEYRFLGELVTLLVAVPRRPQVSRLRLEAATPECLPDMLRVLNDAGRRRQLAAVWTQENIRALARQGLPLERFLLARDGGKIVACGALWDQRGFRQTVIRGYAPTLAMIRPLVNIAARCLGTPRLPRVGSTLAHAFLAPVGFLENTGNALPDFVVAAFPWASKLGVDFLTLALPADDPRLTILRRQFSTRVYHSRLYQVTWAGDPFSTAWTEGESFLPDVALL